MSHCCYKSSTQEQCKLIKNYGGFCYKHRRNYLIHNDFIIINRFTGFKKDYLRNDLVRYYRFKMKNKSKLESKIKLFEEIKNHIESLDKYNELDIQQIIIIQSSYRGRQLRNKLSYMECNNKEDFYTFDPIKEIPSKYFYSYLDNGNMRWGFDIRSLDKLISMGYTNPYTTEVFPGVVVTEIEHKLTKLKGSPSYEDLIDIIIDRSKQTGPTHF